MESAKKGIEMEGGSNVEHQAIRLVPFSDVEPRLPYKVHRNTLIRWARTGLVESVRVGRRYLLTPIGVEQLLSGQINIK